MKNPRLTLDELSKLPIWWFASGNYSGRYNLEPVRVLSASTHRIRVIDKYGIPNVRQRMSGHGSMMDAYFESLDEAIKFARQQLNKQITKAHESIAAATEALKAIDGIDAPALIGNLAHEEQLQAEALNKPNKSIKW